MIHPLVLGSISQKGGVGKSMIARLLGTVYAGAGWEVKIADLNLTQKTATNWGADRMMLDIKPQVAVEPFPNVARAVKNADRYDLLVFDGAPDSHITTLEIARAAHGLYVPSGLAADDLNPQINLVHDLVNKGVPAERFLFVLNMTLDSQASVDGARSYIERAGYRVAESHLPMKTGYQLAHNTGRSVAETQYKSLNEVADKLAQELVDFAESLTKETA